MSVFVHCDLQVAWRLHVYVEETSLSMHPSPPAQRYNRDTTTLLVLAGSNTQDGVPGVMQGLPCTLDYIGFGGAGWLVARCAADSFCCVAITYYIVGCVNL